MTSVRVLALAGVAAMACAPAYAATFTSAQVNNNASAFLGNSVTGLPGDAETHGVSLNTLPTKSIGPVSGINLPAAVAVATAGSGEFANDSIRTSQEVSAQWVNANQGTIFSSISRTLTLPDSVDATLAAATNIDQSNQGSRPAWSYSFTAGAADTDFDMHFAIQTNGINALDTFGLGAWNFLVVDNSQQAQFVEFDNPLGGVGDIVQTLTAGHSYQIELLNNDGLVLPARDFQAHANSDTSEFLRASWTIGQAVGGAVPEPSTWVLAIVGFGLTGASLRRRAQRSLA